MTWWSVSTKHKKSVFEHELYQNDQWVIRRVTCFRWGTVQIETEDDNPPVLDQDSGPYGDAVDMYSTEYNFELDVLSDGCSEDFIWPDDMPEEERDRLLDLINELGVYEALEDEEGYELYETECWFTGPLEIVKDGETVNEDIDEDEFHTASDNVNNGPTAVWPFPTDHKDNEEK